MKRLIGGIVAALILLVLLPLLTMVGCWIALESPGGVLYRQTRIGKGGRPFQLLKLRSMRTDIPGPSITLGHNDARITTSGAWIRRIKMDELPQLWNVIRGEMSWVGPRPEVPEYAALYNEAQRLVLDVRPGLTDPASIDAYDEGKRLQQQPDPEAYYRNVILPEKVDRQLEYMQRANLLSDARVILRTVLRIVKSQH